MVALLWERTDSASESSSRPAIIESNMSDADSEEKRQRQESQTLLYSDRLRQYIHRAETRTYRQIDDTGKHKDRQVNIELKTDENRHTAVKYNPSETGRVHVNFGQIISERNSNGLQHIFGNNKPLTTSNAAL